VTALVPMIDSSRIPMPLLVTSTGSVTVPSAFGTVRRAARGKRDPTRSPWPCTTFLL
jgi:hypothetical protein